MNSIYSNKHPGDFDKSFGVGAYLPIPKHVVTSKYDRHVLIGAWAAIKTIVSRTASSTVKWY